MAYPFVETLRQDRSCFNAVRQWIDEPLLLKLAAQAQTLDSFVGLIGETSSESGFPSYVAEIAAMEAHLYRLSNRLIPFDPYPNQLSLNPGLKIFTNSWKHLADTLGGSADNRTPEVGEEQILIWQAADTHKITARNVADEDLLVLKMAVEKLSSQEVAKLSGTTIAAINGTLLQALETSILLGPRSRVVRSAASSTVSQAFPEVRVPETYMSSRVFAMQWHVTQACDLNCRHCYDRSPCEPLALSQEIDILDSFSEFCSAHQVFGQVSFTGGNPLLHPHFSRLYQEASDRGFFIGILGNPATRDAIDPLIAIQPPAFYQMSLEGLEPHNDHIRGPDHFQKVLAFLDVLKEANIYSKIMLTLTRANLDQVIPLGKILQGRTDVFTFNRLSLMGQGANLVMADPAHYRSFLADYLETSSAHDVFDLKDNLFNILLQENQSPLFGGCTGYGCGAAFNFVSVLATGEVHACRKFHSPIGDLTKLSLNDIYHSERAEQYRRGPEECRSCGLNLVCRGCMAATSSQELDVGRTRDPYCFI